MRVLVVGAGAVGRVLGWHLQRGGAEVTFMVKPHQLDAARRGFALRRLNGRPQRSVRFRGFSLVSCPLEAAHSADWDCIALAVSSTALREGEWLDALSQGRDRATIATFQPGIADYDYVCERAASPERVVAGMLSLVSFAADDDASAPDTTAYWVPPLSKLKLDGPSGRVGALAAAFSRGGLRAAPASDLLVQRAFAGAVVDTQIAALECAGWELRRFRRDRALCDLAAAAAREALAVAARRHCVPPSRVQGWLRGAHIAAVAGLAPHLVPFDLEGYFRRHFTKVRRQTDHSLHTFVTLARELGLQRENLQNLCATRQRGEPMADRAPTSGSTRPRAAMAPGTLRRLQSAARQPVRPRGAFAIKRNVHEFAIGTEAGAFARAFAEVMADPEARFGPIRLKRSPDRVGRPFSAGERIQGCFDLIGLVERGIGNQWRSKLRPLLDALSAHPTVGWLQDRALSDYAEIDELSMEPEPGSGAYRVGYVYLQGTPIAGRSSYTVEPVGPSRCRLTSVFEFQELNGLAVTALHRFGVRAHDEVVRTQVDLAAQRVGARVLRATLAA